MTLVWVLHDPRYSLDAAVGFLPEFISEHNPRGACEQFDAKYIGGWRDIRGFASFDGFNKLMYPGDPPLHLLASAQLRDECIYVYESAFVAVVQPDGSFRVSRLD